MGKRATQPGADKPFSRTIQGLRVWMLTLFGIAAIQVPTGVADPTPSNPELIAATIFPYCTEDGQGFLYKVFKEMSRRVGTDQQIRFLPLGRALEEAKVKPSLLFPIAKSIEREQYLNYGPVLYNDSLVFVVRTGEKSIASSLEQAKGRSVATHLGSTTEAFLHTNGFRNISTAPDNSNLLRMLSLKRVDVIFLANGILRATTDAKKFSRSNFEVALVVSPYPIYLATSKIVDSAISGLWEKVLEEMKADGTFADLTVGY